MIATIIIIGVISIAGASAVKFSSSNARSSEYSSSQREVRYLAESGLAHARSILWSAADPTDPNAIGSGSFTLEDGTVTFEGTYDMGTQIWTLTGTGTVTNPTGPAGAVTDTFSTKVAVGGGGTGSGDPWAIFVGDSTCDGSGFKLNGENATVTGGLHSNGDFQVDGSGSTFEHGSTYGSPCTNAVSGGNDFGGSSTPTVDPTIYPWPNNWTPSDFTCTYSGGDFKFENDGMTIPTGVYCASGKFEVTGKNITGSITVLAEDIIVNNESITLEPAPDPPYNSNDVLFYTTGSNEMILDGKWFTFEGTLYAPNANVKINGEGTTSPRGSIQALQVEINAQDFSLVGSGSPSHFNASGGGGYTLTNVPGSYTG